MRNSVLVHGVVSNSVFYSDNMKKSVDVDDGFYSIDVASQDHIKSIVPSDLTEFENFVKSRSRMSFVVGLSYRNGIIPFNVSKWKKTTTVPIKIGNSIGLEWEVIRVVGIPHRNVYVYYNSLMNDLQFVLNEVKDRFDEETHIRDVKGVTPEIRLLYSFHLFDRLEKIREQKRLEREEFLKTFEGRLINVIESSDGTYISHEKRGNNFLVKWESYGQEIVTLIDNNFRVVQAGFCVSGYDNTQSMGSVVKLLQVYVDDGEHIHRTLG